MVETRTALYVKSKQLQHLDQVTIQVTARDCLDLRLPLRLTAEICAPIWPRLTHTLRSPSVKRIRIDARDLEYCDGAGFGLLAFVLESGRLQRKSVDIRQLSQDIQQLLDRYTSQPAAISVPEDKDNVIVILGRKASLLVEDLYSQITFLGRLFVGWMYLLWHPGRFRWKDFLYVTELAGVNALGVVSLLGFLFGLILVFSSAMPLRQFGAEVYVSDLVALALARVLGPFITAIILTGRTGSAYAAELGSMKINQELDALEVMNLDPVHFLVLPRVLATTCMMPLLTVMTILMGLVGCALVILSLGYPLITFWQHVQNILSTTDVFIGLVKAVVFGFLVGATGCLRGLQTQTGAGAVGQAATRAVVTTIVLLVATEGLFAVLLYLLDI